MRYYVFDSQAAAQSAIDSIDARARTIYAAQGYTVDADGSIIGVRGGVPDPAAAHTLTFAEPRQRLDGKWVVPHIETSPSPNYVIDPASGMTVGVFCVQDLVAPLIETDDGSWFPIQRLGA